MTVNFFLLQQKNVFGEVMKTVQKFFVFGLFATAGLIFAGCGDTGTTGDGGGESTATTEATSDDSGGSAAKEDAEGEGSADKTDGASAVAPSGELQLVSLNVPNMT